MANFTTYSKLHISVVRNSLGDDNTAGGAYVVRANITGTVTANHTLTILGVALPVSIGQTGSQLVTAFVSAFNSLGPGVSAAVSLAATTILEVSYSNTLIYPFPTGFQTTEGNGVSVHYTTKDDRDVAKIMKHSVYADTVEGLGVATTTMFTLISESKATDTIQLQRVSLDALNATLQVENLTQPIIGSAYLTYAI